MKRFALLLLFPLAANAAGPWYINEGQTSVIRNIVLYDASDPDAVITSVTSETSGLTVHFCDNIATSCTTYDAAAEFEPITTFGTYQTPSANNLVFEHIGGGIYQMQFADGLFDSTDVSQMSMVISGGGVYPMDVEIYLDGIDSTGIQTAVQAGIDAEGVAREATLNDMDTTLDGAVAGIDVLIDDVIALGTSPDEGGTGVYPADESITSATFAPDAIVAATLATDVTTELQTGLATAVAVQAIEDQTDDIGVAGIGLTEAGGTGDQFTAIAKVAALQTVDDEIAVIDGIVDSILVDTGTTLDGKIDAIDDFIDTEIATLLAGVDVVTINDNATSATQLALSAATIESGVAEGTPTTTVIQTDLAETQNDIYIGRIIIFTSGDARGEATEIVDYVGATGTLTVTALANAPAAADTFVIL